MTLQSKQLGSFLRFLSSKKSERFSYWLMAPDGRFPVPGKGSLVGTQEEILEELSKAPEGTTVHITLNTTNLNGRRRGDIVACRVLCLDLDREVSREELLSIREQTEPHFIVRSSPGKYHLYWKIDSLIPVDHWSRYQLALAERFAGDYSLGEPTKTIRAPGIPRVLSKGDRAGEIYTPEIVYMLHPEGRGPTGLTEVELGQRFPWLEEAYQEGTRKRKAAFKEAARAAKEIQAGKEGPIEVKEGRNSLLYGLLSREVSLGNLTALEGAHSYGLELNARLSEPLEPWEVDKIAHSAWERGSEKREVREASLERSREKYRQASVPIRNGRERVPDEPFEYDYSQEALDINRFSDDAIRERIFQKFGKSLVRRKKHLYAFNKVTRIWSVQERGMHVEVDSFVREACRDALRDEEFPELWTNEDGEVSAHKRRMEEDKLQNVGRNSRISQSIFQSKEVRTGEDELFDNGDNLFFCINGVLNLDTGELREAQPEDYLFSQSRARYESGASWEWWERFLREVFAEEESPEEMVGFLQELFGYTLSGSIDEQKVFCHYGEGSNGKSKVLWALALLGGDYYTPIDPDELTKRRGIVVKTFEKLGAKIEGKRIAIIDDLEVSTIWNESFVKALTSPDLRARGEYEKSRAFRNKVKIHCGLNEPPKPESEGEGLIRRICLIPYSRYFEPHAGAEDRIMKGIEGNLSGILNWSLEGYRRWKERGRLSYPEDTKIAMREYRRENFTLEAAVEECFETGEDWHSLEILRESLENWARLENKTLGDFTGKRLKAALDRKFIGLESREVWCKVKRNKIKEVRLSIKIGKVPKL